MNLTGAQGTRGWHAGPQGPAAPGPQAQGVRSLMDFEFPAVGEAPAGTPRHLRTVARRELAKYGG
jgi:hypothetical protein